jgi:glycosyltransferase involved in cell wall biosynthesis
MQKVSAVLITYNEENNLPQCLPKLTWCDEIIVVDSGSTDNTVKLCRAFGCKVYHKVFRGYGDQKRYAVAQASNDWVLCLDADEILSNNLVEEIQTEMRNPTADGYLMPMSLVFMNREFKYGKESWRYFMRLFNKTKGGFNDSKVHEKIELQGTTKKLKNLIHHYSYRSFSQYFDKFNKYSCFGAEMAYTKGKRRSVAAIVMAVPLNFMKYYFLQKNFMNGMHGFNWSVLNSFYHFAKYIKLKEHYSNQKNVQLNNAAVSTFSMDPIITQPYSTHLQSASI